MMASLRRGRVGARSAWGRSYIFRRFGEGLWDFEGLGLPGRLLDVCWDDVFGG